MPGLYRGTLANLTRLYELQYNCGIPLQPEISIGFERNTKSPNSTISSAVTMQT